MSNTPIHGHCDPRFSSVREVFEKNFPPDVGAAVAVTLHGEPVVDLWGGHKDPERTDPWTEDTIVNVYSTTKGMAAICAHQLVEQGRLDLDAPVAKYWPEFAQAGKDQVPVRYLLCHKSGLPAPRKQLEAGGLYDWDTGTKALAETEPWWKPGENHGYHALTYGHLVGEVVRRVSGASIGQYFKNHVAEPLDLDFHIGLDAKHDDRVAHMIQPDPTATPSGPADGGDGPPADLLPALAKMMKDMVDPTSMTWAAFNVSQGQQDPNSREWRGAEIPAANGHGTARSLAKVYGALANGGAVDGVRVLKPDTIDAARTEQWAGADAVLGGLPMRFGLGFMLRTDLMPITPGPGGFGHAGAGGSLGFADPDTGVGFGYVMNQMQQGLLGGAGAFALLRAFYDEL
jgi:CubicO group peptidase (beta-lactamase class C family)